MSVSLMELRNTLLKDRQTMVKQEVETVLGLIDSYAERAKKGEFTVEEAQNQVRDIVNNSATTQDTIGYDRQEHRFTRGANRAGGLEGGITNGQDVLVRLGVHARIALAVVGHRAELEVDRGDAVRPRLVLGVEVDEADPEQAVGRVAREGEAGERVGGERQRRHDDWIERRLERRAVHDLNDKKARQEPDHSADRDLQDEIADDARIEARGAGGREAPDQR